jgi:hypothetical protein
MELSLRLLSSLFAEDNSLIFQTESVDVSRDSFMFSAMLTAFLLLYKSNVGYGWFAVLITFVGTNN